VMAWQLAAAVAGEGGDRGEGGAKGGVRGGLGGRNHGALGLHAH
jgi:hypothetical protein